MAKQFCQASENNKDAILEQLTEYFAERRLVLEIGSGTGMHGVYFPQHLPHLIWQTSDLPENHPSIDAWGKEANLENWRAPIEFTIGVDPWPECQADAVFTANTAHIMQPAQVQEMMQLVSINLPINGVFCQYGPFKLHGEFNSDSNRTFNAMLIAQGYGGYRDIDELQQWAKSESGQLLLDQIIDMPANNYLLVWHKASWAE